jgi:hypothetical protein
MIAAAATLACWLAMWPDLGISGAGKVASPSTCTPGAAVDSIVSQFTPTQRLLMLTRPAAARDVAGALRRDHVQHVGLDVLELELGHLAATSFSSALGRYSRMPL